MNSEEFQEFTIKKLIEIEGRLTKIEEQMTHYTKFIKILTAIAAVLAAKLGIDLTGVL